MTSKKSRRVRGSSKKAGTRLGTQIRGEMAEAYDKRGHGAADLVLHYSGKAKSDVGLKGELEYLHFLYAESDPDVVRADYSPLTANTALVGKPFATLVHAVVKTRDDLIVWRHLVESEPDDTDPLADLKGLIGKGPLAQVNRVEVWTMDRLVANPMRLRNSLRAMGWISAARHWPLGDLKAEALKLIRQKRSVTFEEIFSMGEGAHRALYAAAVLELAHSGAVTSDLHEVPLHGMTLFHRIGD